MAYSSHPDLKTPGDAVVLWRYMDFAKFVQMLECKSLWFCRLDQFEDPLEGGHTDAELASIRKHVAPRNAEAIIQVFRESRRTLFVNCWRSGAAESLAMWDLYGKGSGIVAVKSSIRQLKKAVEGSKRDIYISEIKYLDWNQSLGLDNVLVACSRKDLSYQHESEIRVIMSEDESKYALGISLPVDVEQLIDEVIVGPREQKWVVELTNSVMKRYGLSQPVKASDRLTARL